MFDFIKKLFSGDDPFPKSKPRNEKPAAKKRKKKEASPPKTKKGGPKKESVKKFTLEKGKPGKAKTSLPKGDLKLRLGIDFGTSNSKLVIKDDAQGSFVVKGGHDVLYPTTIYYKGYRYSLKEFENSKESSDLKIKLLDAIHKTANRGKKETFDTRFVNNSAFKDAAIYISLLIKLAMEWILQKQGRYYSNYNLKWDIVIGFPSIPSADSSKKDTYERLVHAFKLLAKTGFYLSEKKESEITNSVYSKATQDVFEDKKSPSRSDNPNWCFAYPEILAQLATIQQTDFEMRMGKNILVDIGAGTVDTITFSNNSDDRRLSIYQAAVGFIGAHKFHDFRIRKIILALKKEKKKYEFTGKHPMDQQDGTPFNARNYSQSSVLSPKKVEALLEEAIDPEFYVLVHQLVMGNFADTYNNLRNANLNRNPPSETFQLMLTGGGSMLSVYKAIEKLPFSSINDYELNVKSFPTPTDINNNTTNISKIFHRLSIAYGLAFGNMELYEISTRALAEENYNSHKITGGLSDKRCKNLNCGANCTQFSDYCYFCGG
jgi:hypothetical protein